MDRSAKKQLHEKNRKRHKHEMQENAREMAKRGKSKMPLWFLAGGVAVIIVCLLLASYR